jgi:cell division septum initiation protein DivIVA
VDVHDQLDQIAATVRDAKAMPMSASCLVNRTEMLEALERLRHILPASLDHADALLSDRDALVTAGHEEAKRLLEVALAEREQLIEQSDVLVAARERAAAVATQAQGEATRLLADADDYVDRKLGEFEVVLGQLGSQVNNGRERLAARRAGDLARVRAAVELSSPEEDAPGDAPRSDAPFGRTPSPPVI